MLLALVMIPLIQKELDTFRTAVWNTHRTMHKRTLFYLLESQITFFYFPEQYGLEECGMCSSCFTQANWE